MQKIYGTGRLVFSKETGKEMQKDDLFCYSLLEKICDFMLTGIKKINPFEIQGKTLFLIAKSCEKSIIITSDEFYTAQKIWEVFHNA